MMAYPTMKQTLFLPTTADEWNRADLFPWEHLISKLHVASMVDDKNTLLCEDIYSYFAQLSPNQNHVHNKRYQHHKRSNQHLRAMKAVQEEKRDLKKKLRALKRNGSGEEEVRTLARGFHQLVRKHSKLVRETK